MGALYPSTTRCELTQQHGVDDCHWLPQWIYLPCDFTLHYENLAAEFADFMSNLTARGLVNASGLDVRLSDQAVHRNNCSLTAASLDAKSRALLDRVYSRDFSLLGYESS